MTRSQTLSVLLVLLHTLVACPHIDCWVVCHLKQSHRYPAGLAFNSYQSRHSEGFWELRLSDRGSQTLHHTPMTSGSGSGRCHSGTHWPYMQDTLQRSIQTDEITNNTVKPIKRGFCSNGFQNSFNNIVHKACSQCGITSDSATNIAKMRCFFTITDILL